LSRLTDFLLRRQTVETEETDDLVYRSDQWDAQISQFWSNLSGTSGASNPRLLERVWVANRCLHMNANAISTMPLRFHGNREPAWVANPDPIWYPNGITDAVYAVISSLYGWGDAFVYVTSRYADGYPSAWTVLDAASMTVESRGGKRRYEFAQAPLNSDDMVQISRDPRGGLTGTSAIASYSAYTNGLLAAADLSRVMMAGSVPPYALKPQRKTTAAQASALQTEWMTATSLRRGAPPVLPPDVALEKLGLSPADLLLMDVQQFDAQVIASAFGVPASLINMPIEGGLNYQTPILLLEQWWRTELRTTAVHVANALSAKMLPAGAYVEFDPYKFLAPAWKELVDGWVAMVEKGLATVEQFQTVVLGIPPGQVVDPALALATPPSAGASPSDDQPADVVALRPTQVVN